MKWKTRFIIIFVSMLVILLVGNIVYAQNIRKTQPVTYLGTSDEKYVKIAEQYLKQKLGEDYYNQQISFSFGETWEDCTKEYNCSVVNLIHFKHQKISSLGIQIDENERYRSNVTVYEGDDQRLVEKYIEYGIQALRTLSSIRVELSNEGNVVKYLGPLKSYNFLITKDEAINKAKSYGYNTIIDATLVGIPMPNGYEVLWVVDSSDLLECRWQIYFESASTKLCSFNGVYIDVDTGEIRGEYNATYSSAFGNIVRSQSNGIEVSLRADSKLSEFFEKQATSKPNEIKNPNNNFGIKSLIITIIIIILIVVFLMWYRLRRK